MILYRGKIYDTACRDKLLSTLYDDVNETLYKSTLDRQKLLRSVDAIASGLLSGKYSHLIKELDIDGLDGQIERAAELMRYENTAELIKAQLPHAGSGEGVKRYIMPSGVLFHIAAGNADVLPAYSVLSGLVCGNVNVLKLPSQDNGITVKILSGLVEEMPELAEYIYVFDTPSSDVPSMIKMADVADRIVVWGGDEAVAAVRRIAPPSVPIVEWGHRIGFCCVTGGFEKHEDELYKLAEHIIKTSQLFCSSCQRIYVIDPDPYSADRFCRFFLPILQEERYKRPQKDIGAVAEVTLMRYSQTVEAAMTGVKTADRVYTGNGCSLSVKDDPELEISGFFGHVDVTALSLEELFRVLRRKRGYLQTASVIADGDELERIENTVIRAGVVRITPPDKMSFAYTAEPHDGVAELGRYCRIVSKYTEEEQ